MLNCKMAKSDSTRGRTGHFRAHSTRGAEMSVVDIIAVAEWLSDSMFKKFITDLSSITKIHVQCISFSHSFVKHLGFR